MITVTLTGPTASGKTRTIEYAMAALKANGVKCLRDEEKHSTPAARQRHDVVFTSNKIGQALGFSIVGTGPIGAVSNVVHQALAKVRAENARPLKVRR